MSNFESKKPKVYMLERDIDFLNLGSVCNELCRLKTGGDAIVSDSFNSSQRPIVEKYDISIPGNDCDPTPASYFTVYRTKGIDRNVFTIENWWCPGLTQVYAFEELFSQEPTTYSKVIFKLIGEHLDYCEVVPRSNSMNPDELKIWDDSVSELYDWIYNPAQEDAVNQVNWIIRSMAKSLGIDTETQ
ncbi:hypothetical protein KA068_01320 [Candidatus Saccharibacteria bacterium]|nr:hypothetical protein [Candidatus Saccharibacteria bacterium]